MGKISIYQVFTRLFGVKNEKPRLNGSLEENGVGKMADFTAKALQEIKAMGITHIWYTGIIEHASCEKYPEFGIKGQNPQIVKGKAGSPYAITDYFDVNPYLAKSIPNRMKEFENLVARTHKNGLKVIIDFVPNHVARQYKSDVYPDKDFGKNDNVSMRFSASNDFYYMSDKLHLQKGMGTEVGGRQVSDYEENPAKATGNDGFTEYPTINDWYETVKLNYGVDLLDNNHQHFDPIPPLWDKMVEVLRFWAKKNIDAFRCDMAEMVPVDFWNYAVGKIKAEFPDVQFIAEVYNPCLYESYLNYGKFDFLYDKVGLYDTLRGIIQHNLPAYDITKCWQGLNGIDNKMLRFLENHDEHRIASSEFAENPSYAIPAMIVSATLHQGPVMVYFGQELGEPAKGASGYSGNDGKTTIFDFYNVPEFQKWYNKGNFGEQRLSDEQKLLRNFYKTLLNASISEKAIADGNFYDLMWVNNFEEGPNTTKIYAYIRYTDTEVLLIIVNFDKEDTHKFRLKIPEHAYGLLPLTKKKNLLATNLLCVNSTIKINKYESVNNGIELSLSSNSGAIYKIGF